MKKIILSLAVLAGMAVNAQFAPSYDAINGVPFSEFKEANNATLRAGETYTLTTTYTAVTGPDFDTDGHLELRLVLAADAFGWASPNRSQIETVPFSEEPATANLVVTIPEDYVLPDGAENLVALQIHNEVNENGAAEFVWDWGWNILPPATASNRSFNKASLDASYSSSQDAVLLGEASAYKVFDIVGRTVLSGSGATVDTSSLISGVYIISTENGTKKFAK